MTSAARRVCAIVTSALTLVTASALGAQSFPTGPAVARALHDTTLVTQIPGRWNAKGASIDSRLTPTERGAMVASLGHIAEILHTALGALPGVEADVAQNTERYATPGGGHVAGGTVKVLLWPYSVRNGKLAFYNNAAEALFWVNKSVCQGDAAFDQDMGYILAPRRTGSFHGFPMIDSTIVITHRTQPPCLPVSREEVIQALVHKIAAGGASADSVWDAGMAERERGLTELAKSNPTAAANARAEMARLRRTTDSARTSVEQMLTAALARMSPAERASAAYISNSSCHGGTDISTCLVGPGVADARAIVRENPAFFDAARPADVQLITLSIASLYNGADDAEYPTKVMDQALARFDWAALSAMVH